MARSRIPSAVTLWWLVASLTFAGILPVLQFPLVGHRHRLETLVRVRPHAALLFARRGG